MKRVQIVIILWFTTGLLPLHAQMHQYGRHHVQRQIKALSEKQIQGYLAGEGMGMALPAELNHFPGPRHVLDLADSLNLTPGQHQQIQAIYDQMHRDAVRLGKAIVEKEKALENLFAQSLPDSQKVHQVLREIGTLNGELRWVHIQAHLQTRGQLSKYQVAEYDRLRGYRKP